MPAYHDAGRPHLGDVGAGDACLAGIVHARLDGYAQEDTLRAGVRLGFEACTTYGATPRMDGPGAAGLPVDQRACTRVGARQGRFSHPTTCSGHQPTFRRSPTPALRRAGRAVVHSWREWPVNARRTYPPYSGGESRHSKYRTITPPACLETVRKRGQDSWFRSPVPVCGQFLSRTGTTAAAVR